MINNFLNFVVYNVIFYLFLLIGASGQQEGDFYTAAVVEYEPYRNKQAHARLKPIEILDRNLKNYINILDNIKEELDLIVYPESTLTFGIGLETPDIATELPKTPDETVCNSTNPKYAQFLRDLSCAAVNHSTFLVVNLVGKEPCSDGDACPKSGYFLYNTDVVFNRQGQVIAHYYKYNLFGEVDMTKPQLEVVTFSTDKAEFGIFTCFDILFQTPTLNLTRQTHVKNIVFPTMWFSELPFLTALQTQQMWSQENDVVFLSSGASNPYLGSGGTGIFLGQNGALNYTFQSQGGTSVLIQKVPLQIPNKASRIKSDEDTDALAKDMDNVKLLRDKIEPYTSQIFDPNQTYTELCHGTTPNKFCCTFNIKTSIDYNKLEDGNQYTYHLIAFSGVRSFSGVYNAGVDVCAIIACQNNFLSSCASRFANYSEVVWPITFNSLTIQANFSNTENKIQFPNSLLSSIRPIQAGHVAWSKDLLENGSILRRTLGLKKAQNRLMTFAIYGRDFSRDSAPKRKFS